MKNRFLAAIAVAVAFTGLSLMSAVADYGKGCDRKGDGSCIERMAAELKLTKEQKAKIGEFKDECKKTKIRVEAEIQATRIDLHSLLKKDNIDKSTVDAKVNELGDLIKKALKNKTDCKVKVLSVLDAEQKKVFLESGGCDMDRGDGGCGKKDHDCGKKEHDCGKGDDCCKKMPECCKRGDDCCKKGEDCCKGMPECCKRGDDCCMKGGSGAGCDVKKKKDKD